MGVGDARDVLGGGLERERHAELRDQLGRAEPDQVRPDDLAATMFHLLGLNPATLPPRDRERFWNTAIGHARVDSPEATAAGDALALLLAPAGYVVGPPPGRTS